MGSDAERPRTVLSQVGVKHEGRGVKLTARHRASAVGDDVIAVCRHSAIGCQCVKIRALQSEVACS